MEKSTDKQLPTLKSSQIETTQQVSEATLEIAPIPGEWQESLPEERFEILGALARVRGDVGFYRRLLESFLETSFQTLEAMGNSLLNQEWSELRAFAHTLKGEASTLGSIPVAHAAALLEGQSDILLQEEDSVLRQALPPSLDPLTQCLLEFKSDLAKVGISASSRANVPTDLSLEDTSLNLHALCCAHKMGDMALLEEMTIALPIDHPLKVAIRDYDLDRLDQLLV